MTSSIDLSGQDDRELGDLLEYRWWTAGELRCSFCGKVHTEVDRLVAGPGVHICNECVALAEAIFDEYRDKPAELRLPVWGSMTDEEVLTSTVKQRSRKRRLPRQISPLLLAMPLFSVYGSWSV